MRPTKTVALWELGMWETALRMSIMVVDEWKEGKSWSDSIEISKYEILVAVWKKCVLVGDATVSFAKPD